MKRKILFGLILSSGCLMSAVHAQGVADGSLLGKDAWESLLANNRRAAEIVNRAVKAIGGAEKVRTLKAVSMSYEGDVSATFQGPNPKSPHRSLPRSGDLTFNIEESELTSRNETKWPNFTQRSNTLYRESKTYELDDQAKTYRSSDDDEVYRAWNLRFLPLLLRRIGQSPMELRYEGRRAVDGRMLDVVSAPVFENKMHRIYFSPSSGLPEVVEYLDYRSDFGDLTVKTIFSDFRQVDGIQVPMAVKAFYNGHVYSSHVLKDVLLNEKVKQEPLAVLKDYKPASADANRGTMRTRSIAEGIYLIENLGGRDYNVMFADLGESLIVFEAPIDTWASKMAMAEIRKVFPSKPIKYVMVSHFHDDHAAGIRNYMADGVTVITTPGNRAYFEAVARLPHTFHPENSLLKPTEPKFELVTGGRYEIRGKDMTIRFLDLGPTAHVDENIVAFIPERKIIFQGDFFRVPAAGAEPEALRDEGVAFYNKLIEHKLDFRQLVGAHGPIGGISDLERALAVRNAASVSR